jgi:hypothetical protein
MRNGVLIKYGDVAMGAREQFVPNSEDKAYFVEFDELKQMIDFPNYTNPCELYSTALDGEDLPIPSDAVKANLGWWSGQISDENGVFEEPIVLTAQADDLFSSIGITLTFDTINNVYADNVSIKWYRNGELISEKEFYPNSSIYLCQNPVELYNKIEITFYSINMPQNRLKVHDIEYGYGAEFGGDELKSVKITQQINPMSAEIAINTCDFILISKRNIEYSFRDRQVVETYFNGRLRCKTFIKDFKRKSKTEWSIQTEDYIGIMENVSFYGGIYQNANAQSVLEEIFAVAGVPFTLDGAIFNKTISGYIPYTTCREALMQVAFAIGAVIDTSNRQDVYVYVLSDELTQTIPLSRIMQGQNFTNQTKVTAFELTEHQYSPIDEEAVLYRASDNGAGENIFVRFSMPIHDLSITNGQINSSGTNYAIINANMDCVLKGKKYDHVMTVKTKRNPLVLSTDTENIISIQNATLVSKNNVDNLLEKCYNYFANTREVNLKIVEGKHISYAKAVKYGEKKYGSFKYSQGGSSVVYDKPVNVGDLIEAETEYLGNIQGRAIEQTFNLNGGIIIKNTVMR